MQAAIAHYEEVRHQRLMVQEQLVKIHSKINETIVNQKRIEAEIEEVRIKVGIKFGTLSVGALMFVDS